MIAGRREGVIGWKTALDNDKHRLQRSLTVQVVKELPVGKFQAPSDGAKPLRTDADKSRNVSNKEKKKKEKATKRRPTWSSAVLALSIASNISRSPSPFVR